MLSYSSTLPFHSKFLKFYASNNISCKMNKSSGFVFQIYSSILNFVRRQRATKMFFPMVKQLSLPVLAARDPKPLPIGLKKPEKCGFYCVVWLQYYARNSLQSLNFYAIYHISSTSIRSYSSRLSSQFYSNVWNLVRRACSPDLSMCCDY